MRAAAFWFLLLASPLWGNEPTNEPIRIAVAANFRSTLQQINNIYALETGARMTLSSASTGVLASQIMHGAPFDLFFAADHETPAKLSESSPDTDNQPFCYATGKLVLAGGDTTLSKLQRPQFSLAIANPATAPYGQAAMEVLARAEFNSGSGRKLVRGSNIVQAYQFWHSGSTDLALLPLSMAPDNATPIPQGWHRPLQQHALALSSRPAVTAYLQWFRSDRVRTLISQAGYDPCF